MILMIDNYDSFTYNLVQYLEELAVQLGLATASESVVKVVRNDQFSLSDIEQWQPDYIVLSPGPCTPNEAGLCLDLVKNFASKIPMFGVCLGMQCMVQALGGKIVHAKQVMHGKTSSIVHDGAAEYFRIPQPFTATRYHSLVADLDSLPKNLIVTSWTCSEEENCQGQIEELMGIRHREWPLVGVQYHPESILTSEGKNILKNFLNLYRSW
ncbi:MAG: aminodeoxychorismate/anthranilate synthase component II [Gammaproteobacteria bacterium]|nr:aminodeoxychorismate/anthranilate synthase component II [Gammaproteobacteria bacterium]NNC97616.1 aminodeoxychorismate/anthranilate synthase component II [Gammaproteobacteria bacterium]NNM14198.1 aminodeoxychorismate/anthranilate synthase component II [Gammaproteobacteria bacterium]